jgi:tripartite-type tricarboxylate transporter receptor subunit TctC
MPGNPKVIVTNLPGGGGLRGLQETMRSRPDGLTIHPMAPRHPAAEAGGIDRDDFDIDTVNLIGTPSFNDDHLAMCVRRDVATSWEEVLALGRPITTGTSAPGGDMVGGQFIEALGGPIKVIFGYEGTSEVLAAIDRGELDATTRCDFEYISNLYPGWYEDRLLIPLFWSRSPISQEFLDRMGTGLQPDEVPHMFDIIDATDEQKDVFLLAQNLESLARMFVMAPNTPEEIVLTWQRVFRQIVEDPTFIAKAELAERPVKYGDPAVLVENLRKAAGFSNEARALFATLYGAG